MSKLALHGVVFLVSIIGALLARFLQTVIEIKESSNLTRADVNNLIEAVLWLVITAIVYFGARKVAEARFSIFSLDYFLAWVVCSLGVVIGFIVYIIIDKGSATLNGKDIISEAIRILPLALGPAGAVAVAGASVD